MWISRPPIGVGREKNRVRKCWYFGVFCTGHYTALFGYVLNWSSLKMAMLQTGHPWKWLSAKLVIPENGYVLNWSSLKILLSWNWWWLSCLRSNTFFDFQLGYSAGRWYKSESKRKNSCESFNRWSLSLSGSWNPLFCYITTRSTWNMINFMK